MALEPSVAGRRTGGKLEKDFGILDHGVTLNRTTPDSKVFQDLVSFLRRSGRIDGTCGGVELLEELVQVLSIRNQNEPLGNRGNSTNGLDFRILEDGHGLCGCHDRHAVFIVVHVEETIGRSCTLVNTKAGTKSLGVRRRQVCTSDGLHLHIINVENGGKCSSYFGVDNR